MTEECRIGRPSKFTPERRAKIIESISNYVPYEIAAEANGICDETLYAWIREGREDVSNNISSEKAAFSEAIKYAEQNKISQHANKIASGVDKWQADAWLLERRWWKYFSGNVPIREMSQRLDELEKGKKDNGKA